MDLVPDLLPNGKPNPMKGRVASRGETPASAGNVANIVTVARILLAPALVLRAILTDAVDGFLARDRNLVTDQGKLLDPIADKVLIGGALVGLSILGELPWWVTVVILVREVGITVWRLVALRDRV